MYAFLLCICTFVHYTTDGSNSTMLAVLWANRGGKPERVLGDGLNMDKKNNPLTVDFIDLFCILDLHNEPVVAV